MHRHANTLKNYKLSHFTQLLMHHKTYKAQQKQTTSPNELECEMLIINWPSFCLCLDWRGECRPEARHCWLTFECRMTFVSHPLAESPWRPQLSDARHTLMPSWDTGHSLRITREAYTYPSQWFDPKEADESGVHSGSALHGLLALLWKNYSHKGVDMCWRNTPTPQNTTHHQQFEIISDLIVETTGMGSE